MEAAPPAGGDLQRQRAVRPEHQLVHARLLVHAQAEGPRHGRQGHGRRHPSGHDVVGALRRVRPAVPDAGVHDGRVHLVAVQDRQRAGRRGAAAVDRAG